MLVTVMTVTVKCDDVMIAIQHTPLHVGGWSGEFEDHTMVIAMMAAVRLTVLFFFVQAQSQCCDVQWVHVCVWWDSPRRAVERVVAVQFKCADADTQ